MPVASAEQARQALATMPRVAIAVPAAPPVPTADLPQRRVQWQRHKVKPGETLTGLANKYGVSVAALRQANGLHTGMLRKDQDVLIPVVYAADTRPGPARGCDGERVVHRVKPGETLWAIARRYQVDVARITACNPALAGGRIAAGQTVSVFRAPEATAVADANRSSTYTVRQGDTPGALHRTLASVSNSCSAGTMASRRGRCSRATG